MTYKYSLKPAIISLTIFLSVFLAVWATFSLYSSKTNSSTQGSATPDAFMEDVVAVILDKQGKPKMKIVSPKMVYYSKDDSTHLEAPQLTIYRKSPKPWYVSAKEAIATEGTEHVHFKNDVMIQRAADRNNPATVIKTTTLLVHPNTQIAETNDPITLIQPNITVNGIGMYADMNNGDIKLLSDARGEYVPS